MGGCDAGPLAEGRNVKVTVTYEGRVVTDIPPDTIEACLDDVMEELLRLGALDPAVGATLATREVEVSVVVEAPSLDEAVKVGSATIRSAIHCAGGHTPGWDVAVLQIGTAHEPLVESR